MNPVGGRGGRGVRPAMSEINVTPFVDVMLVLLIIFMVTAPLIQQQGIDVDLPKTQSEGLTGDEERLIVTVKAGGEVFVQRTEVKPDELEAKLEAILEARENKEVFLRADHKAAYGSVAKALASLQRAGASRIGMVTEPST